MFIGPNCTYFNHDHFLLQKLLLKSRCFLKKWATCAAFNLWQTVQILALVINRCHDRSTLILASWKKSPAIGFIRAKKNISNWTHGVQYHFHQDQQNTVRLGHTSWRKKYFFDRRTHFETLLQEPWDMKKTPKLL